jgi:hypothetical protein
MRELEDNNSIEKYSNATTSIGTQLDSFNCLMVKELKILLKLKKSFVRVYQNF